MTVLLRRVTPALVVLFVLAAPAAAQQTGTLIGVVRDPQGAVLPGVTITVSSDALIGGSRSVVSGEAGAYQVPTLPPGTYTITYELTGFAPLRHDGIILQVARTTRVDVDLSVGSLNETVTVSGESPVVDVSSTVTQTNISKDLYEAIPTGRNPWVMAGLVPGVVAAASTSAARKARNNTTSRRSGRPTARSRSASTGSRSIGPAAMAAPR